ncbi:hypothetical protein JRI60_24870 [Archangium violaceum]|uniref:hypothetical protein n=1 Tax=Archangium violaceum TaxID=83451 RepID=UPI00194FF16D|nr:hypothetical protein [Archangium violaceum]QRO02016.1 hypothetical protein JRI60_24870 [Archangium violaceum]
MHRLVLERKAPLWVACLLAGLCASVPAAAQSDCNSNAASCDFQERKTTLRAQLWSSACLTGTWKYLSAVYFPMENGQLVTSKRAQVNFLNGVCAFHQDRRYMDSKKAREQLDRGIDELQRAQTSGLLRSQRHVAALLEGLLHCERMKQLAPEVETKLTSRELFCVHRGMAKASFTSVNWANMALDYPDSTAFSVGKHIESMGACYSSHLSAGTDATCGVVTSLPEEQVKSIGTQVGTTELSRYLGSVTDQTSSTATGVGPLTAMLARKFEMVDGAAAGSAQLFSDLKQRNERLRGSYTGLAEMYCSPTGECNGPIPSRVQAMSTKYQAVTLKVQNLLGFVDRWVNGLYQDSAGRDVRTELARSKTDLTDTLATLQGQEAFLDKIRLVKRDMSVLARGAEAEDTVLRKLCSLYFCEIRGGSRETFRKTCAQVDPILSKPRSELNKLCSSNVETTYVSGDGQTTAAALCRNVGLGAYIADGRKDILTCMNTFYVNQ